MKLLLALAFLLTAYISMAEPADAASITVRSGKTTLIANLVDWNARCRSRGYARVRGISARNGRVSARRGGRYAIPSRVLSGKAGKCAGRRIPGVGIYYRSKRGFRGRDVVRFQASPARSGRYYTQRVTVFVR